MAILGTIKQTFLVVKDPYKAQGLRRRPRLSDSFVKEAAVAAVVVNFSISMTRAATFTIFPMYAVQQGLNNPGLFLLVVAVGTFPARQLTGRAFDRYVFPVVFLPSLVGIAASILLIPMTHSAIGLLVLGAFFGLGLALAYLPSLRMPLAACPTTSGAPQQHLHPRRRSSDERRRIGPGIYCGAIGSHRGLSSAGLSPVMAIVLYRAVKGLKRARLLAEGAAAER